MCEEYGLYTCGSNEEYNHLLYDLCSIDDELNYRVVSDSDIEKIARDIVCMVYNVTSNFLNI